MSGGSAAIAALENVSKDYDGVAALRGLDLRVEAGQVYGFLGRNGAGKSTTLRILMGITRPTSGKVILFGESVATDQPAVRRRIGYVAQDQNFYGWMTPQTLGEFLEGFYPGWDDAEYARLLGLLEVPPARTIGTFSGGTQAKLALAAALAHRPELLVLDEPTAGMDAVTRREFLSLVREQARRSGRATLFSSHLIDEVELGADTVGIVDHGAMIWQGALVDLRVRTRQLTIEGPTDAVSAHPLPPLRADVQVLEDRLSPATSGSQRSVIVSAGDPVALTELEAQLAMVSTGWTIQRAPLEDVFVALVSKRLSY